MNKKVLLTGFQPSGNGRLTLGNYAGAIAPSLKLSREADRSFICVVDLHALTMPITPQQLSENSYNTFLNLLAFDYDRTKTTIFIQSHNPGHTELSWLLATQTGASRLNHMIQYKEKSVKAGEDSSLALYTYPVLMAADILLYGATHVPVGKDQTQHLELTIDLANKINSKLGPTFIVPNQSLETSKISLKSLTDPTLKMSKSDPNQNSCIYLDDEIETATKKIMRAATDSLGVINYDPVNQPGITNLLDIYMLLNPDMTTEKVLSKFEQVNYGNLKSEVSKTVANFLTKYQLNLSNLKNNPELVEKALLQGQTEAISYSEPILKRIKANFGLIAL